MAVCGGIFQVRAAALTATSGGFAAVAAAAAARRNGAAVQRAFAGVVLVVDDDGGRPAACDRRTRLGQGCEPGLEPLLRSCRACVVEKVIMPRRKLSSEALLSSRLFLLVALRHVREPPAVRATPVHAPGLDEAVLAEEVTTIDPHTLAGRRLLHAYGACVVNCALSSATSPE